MQRVEQFRVDLVEHFLVVVDVFLLDDALELGVDLLGQRVHGLCLQLHVLHVHLVDLVLDLLQLLVQTRLLRLDGIGFALSLVDLVWDRLLDLLHQVRLLLDQLGLLSINCSGFKSSFILLRLDRVLDEGIRLLVCFMSVKLFDKLLRFDLNLQLDHLLLQFVVFSVLGGNFLVSAHFCLLQLLLLRN